MIFTLGYLVWLTYQRLRYGPMVVYLRATELTSDGQPTGEVLELKCREKKRPRIEFAHRPNLS